MPRHKSIKNDEHLDTENKKKKQIKRLELRIQFQYKHENSTHIIF